MNLCPTNKISTVTSVENYIPLSQWLVLAEVYHNLQVSASYLGQLLGRVLREL